MENNSQSRKWQITINNPVDKGYTHEVIKDKLNLIKSLIYWCMSDEVGEKGTYHTHLYIACSSAVRFSTIKKNFEGSHIEMAKGTSQQNRDYVFKEGKWENDKKKETSIRDTQEEYGELPIERQGSRTDIHDLYDMIKGGLTNYEILETDPSYMLQIDKIERSRQIIREEKYKNTFRVLETTYVTGATGTGKTRTIMEEYGYTNVYRITDYKNPWDNYKGQEIVIFEEFRSSLRCSDMLNYLDGYPLELPCRYSNKIACFTKVFIITNIEISEQYEDIQTNYVETWNALLRRIHKVKIYEADGDIHEYTLKDLNGMLPCRKNRKIEKLGKIKENIDKPLQIKADLL